MDMQKMKEQLARLQGSNPAKTSGGGNNFVWMPYEAADSLKVRILPNRLDTPNRLMLGDLRRTHKVPGEDGKDHKVVCLSTYSNSDIKCPICSVLESQAHVIPETYMKEWEARGKSYFNVLVYDSQEHSPFEPKILGISENFLYWLYEEIQKPEIGDLTDINAGAPITLQRKKDGGAINKSPARLSVPIADTPEKVQAILDKRHDFMKMWPDINDSIIATANLHAKVLVDLIETRIKSMVGQQPPVIQQPVQQQQAYTQSPPTTPAGNVTHQPAGGFSNNQPLQQPGQYAPAPQMDNTTQFQPAPVQQQPIQQPVQQQPVLQQQQPVQQQPIQQPVQQPVQAASGCPDPSVESCFGKDYNADADKCIMCPYEEQCGFPQ